MLEPTGYAKGRLVSTWTNSRYFNQIRQLEVELGVGICYSNYFLRFLFDEDHPIMISGATGVVDRMSGFSWSLRAAIKKNLCVGNVLQIVDSESSKGVKDQHCTSYDVNG